MLIDIKAGAEEIAMPLTPGMLARDAEAARRKKVARDERVAFEHCARQFYIGCAKHVLPLANLPEFQDVIEQLEIYDRNPTDAEDRALLRKMYNKLWSKKVRRDYGYTPIGAFLRGLRLIVRATLEPNGTVGHPIFDFADAYDRAFDFMCPDYPGAGFKKEAEWQEQFYNELKREAALTIHG